MIWLLAYSDLIFMIVTVYLKNHSFIANVMSICIKYIKYGLILQHEFVVLAYLLWKGMLS